MGEAATIDMFADRRFLEKIPNYRGKLCGSGYNLVSIEPNGLVARCGSGVALGNLLSKTVKLLRRRRSATLRTVPYFCEKYTTPEFTRLRKEDVSFLSSLSSFARRFIQN